MVTVQFQHKNPTQTQRWYWVATFYSSHEAMEYANAQPQQTFRYCLVDWRKNVVIA